MEDRSAVEPLAAAWNPFDTRDRPRFGVAARHAVRRGSVTLEPGMLKRLHVDNFRCLVNFDLTLEELTLLVGPNGSGKSSVLDVLSALRRLLGGMAKVTDPGVFPPPSLTRWQQRNLQAFELAVALEGDANLTYRMEVEHDVPGRRARITLETLAADLKPLFEFRQGDVQLYRDDHSEGPRYHADWSESAMARVAERKDNTRLTRFRDFIRGMTVCALDPKRFLPESRSEDAFLEFDGANFASWYRHQIQERSHRIHSVVDAVSPVIDGFHSIRMEKVGADTRAPMVAFDHVGARYELRLDELSDGQRALIALYALVRLSDDTNVVLLDEPDNYLALAEIQPWLLALSDACGASLGQAIVCSHHPEMLDYFGTDSGFLLSRENGGPVSVRPLSEVVASQKDSGLRLSEIVARGWEL